jgi:hypothetical protein
MMRAALLAAFVTQATALTTIAQDSAASSRGPSAKKDACPPAGAPPLRGTPTERGRLDFTGGYEAHARCEWAIRCEGDQQVAALRLTALDTQAHRDFVSLYDGGSELSPRLAHVSGSALPATSQFDSTGGELLVVFSSDNYTEADGFAAEYWCAAPGKGSLAPQGVQFQLKLPKFEPPPQTLPRLSILARRRRRIPSGAGLSLRPHRAAPLDDLTLARRAAPHPPQSTAGCKPATRALPPLATTGARVRSTELAHRFLVGAALAFPATIAPRIS